MPLHHMTPPSPADGQEPAAMPPAVAIHVHGWHLQIDALPRPPRWLVVWAAALVGSVASVWGLLAR